MFDTNTIQFFGIIIIILTAATALVTSSVIRNRRDRFVLRSIPAYEAIPMLAGKSIEASNPLHLSFGSAGIGGGSTLLALSSAEFFYHAAYEVAIGDVSPIISMTDTSAIPLGLDTVRRAYRARQLPERFRANSARWYPAGSRSLAFAAAVTGMMSDDKVSSHLLVGSFGTELALIADAAYRWKQPLIAGSDQLEGQAIAYALADEALIGEEIFAASSYFGKQANQVAVAISINVLRWALIAFMLFLMILSFLQQGR